MFEAPEGMSWGDVGLLTASFPEEENVSSGGADGLNIECLQRMLHDEDQAAKGILTFWLDLNCDQPDRLSTVLCPAHLETVHGVLALGSSSPPKPIRLRTIPGGKLSDVAHAEATFLLRLKQLQLEYGGMLTRIFGDVAYTLPSGPLSVIVADSKRRLIEAIVEEPAPLIAAARHLSGASVKAAGVSTDFLEELFRMARRCGESAQALHECCHELQIPQKLFALASTPLRQRAAEALRAMTACGGIGAWCVKEAAARVPESLQALAAGTGEAVGVEEELLCDVLRCISKEDPFGGVFAKGVLGELVQKCETGNDQPGWRLASAWLKRGHQGGAEEVGKLLDHGAKVVRAFCHPRRKAEVSACTVLEILRFALHAAVARDDEVVSAVEQSGIVDAAVAIAAVAPGTVVKRGGMLQQMAERLTETWLMRTDDTDGAF